MKRLIEKFRLDHIMYKCIVICGLMLAVALLASCSNPAGGGGSGSGGGYDPSIYEELDGIYLGDGDDGFDYVFEIDETGMGGTGFVLDHGSFYSIRAANAVPSSGQTFTWKVIRVRGDEVDVEITVEGEQPVPAVFNTKDGTMFIDGKRYKIKDAPGELKSTPSVGSIIMKDGTLRTKDSISEADKQNAIAVVYKVDTANKQAWAVGKVQNKDGGWGVQWCASYASGSNKYIGGLDTTINNRSFSGYTDGRTGLASLKSAVTDYWPAYYPAWYWCMEYGTKQAGFTNTDGLAKGWYFPSVKELYDIYQVKSAVETSLEASGGSKFGGSNMDYWSSSQESPYRAFLFNFDTGSYSSINKNQMRWVCAVRVFTY